MTDQRQVLLDALRQLIAEHGLSGVRHALDLVDGEDFVFGDINPDDVFTEGDIEVDWSRVEEVRAQIAEINDITDDNERLEAAKQWARDLAGEAVG